MRRFGQYYEAAGEYAVAKELAYDVTRTAAARISRLVGPIALVKQRGLKLSSNSSTINPKRINLPETERHNIFITKRKIELPGDPRIQGMSRSGTCYMGGEWPRTYANVLVTTHNDSEMMIATTAHEIAHTFGIGHCVLRSCIMAESFDSSKAGELAAINNPFCDEHTEELELASYKALAERL